MITHGLTRYKRGCRCPECRAANTGWQANRARLIAYGRWDGRIDATGTKRRIQALMRNGWSMALLSARLGYSRQVLRKQLLEGNWVTAATVTQVCALYDELWDQAPPEGDRFERRAATMARRFAAERGWPPPLAWDDDEIDNPDARPADRWERARGRAWGALAEEAAELAAQGEHPEMIAIRLAASVKSVERTLTRAAAREAA